MSNSFKHIHADLLQKCLKQDPKAQLEIYNLYHGMVYATAIRFVKNAMDAEELMHEAFLTAFNRLDSYKQESAFGAWLKQIVIRKCLDRLKLQSWLEEDHLPKELPQDDEKFWSGPSVQEIVKAIDQLPKGYATILKLYLLEGYDHEEISEILGISCSSSRSQYTRAKAKLRPQLKAMGYGR